MWVTALAVLFLGACATKPAPVPEGRSAASEAEQASQQGSSFLWEVTGESGKAYLLGSIHVGSPAMYPMPDAVEQAFAESEVLALEVDIDNMDATSVQAKLLQMAQLPRGRTLSGTLSPERYEAVARVFEQVGVDPRMMEPFRPWFVALTLSLGAIAQAGYSPEFGIDQHFHVRAKERNLPIVELESADFQIDLFSGFDEKTEELFLYSTLLTLATTGADLQRMIDAWRAGDTGRLERIMMESVHQAPETKEVYERINTDRNPGMAEKVEGFLSTGKTHFVVVGSAHLVGEGGVPKLLEKKGLRVVQR